MLTSRRRHAITETDDISSALEIALQAWPELADKLGALLRQLILVGQNTLAQDRVTADESRRHAVEATTGALPGVFGPAYLSELRADWPE